METAISLLSSPAGQLLVGAAITQALSIAGGMSREDAAANFAASVTRYELALAEWQLAEKTTPEPKP